jgi:hypothetical protein
MLFDDPSSSSPAFGDARLAPPAARRRDEPGPAPRARLFAGMNPDPDRDPAHAHAPRVDVEPASDEVPVAGVQPTPDPRLIETAGAPEPEALRATTVASAVVRELYETGREVRFAFVPTRERVTVLLCDMDGVVLSRLTPARALEIATGEPMPGGRRR